MSGKVLLLHGLLMRRPALLPLARRLRGLGYDARMFTYSSLWDHPQAAIVALRARLRELRGEGPVHLVAHSLGGLIAAAALDDDDCADALPPGRLVCLGSPIGGSAAARGLRKKRLGLVSGRSGGLLREGLPRLPPGREVGMIAGTRAFGLGQFFGRFKGDNDGTVAVAETRLPGLAAHVAIPCSHTGLVFSVPVSDLVDRFLRHGHFQERQERGQSRNVL